MYSCMKFTLHSPSQLHNAVHFRFAQTHLHWRVMQPVLHPHRSNSRQHLSASGIVVHTGVHPSLSLDHPQSPGFGSAQSAVSACYETWPAWYTALLTCCTSAFLVGGILAISKPRVKSVCLAAFTSLWFDVRSYIRMVNRSNSDSVLSERVIKEKLRLPPHLYSVTPYLAKCTLLLILMLHFRMCNILKFTQNGLVVLIPYLLIYSQQCFVVTLLRHIAFMHNVFCFNGFNQTAIVLRYSAHIIPRKMILCCRHFVWACHKIICILIAGLWNCGSAYIDHKFTLQVTAGYFEALLVDGTTRAFWHHSRIWQSAPQSLAKFAWKNGSSVTEPHTWSNVIEEM